MTKLSARAGSLPGSVTLSIAARAKEIAAAGEKVLAFGVGQPDFDTPEHIKDAARKALDGRIGGFGELFGSRKELTTTSFDLYNSPTFALRFGQLDWSNAMSVRVFDSTPVGTEPVPEPGTWALMLGLLVLVFGVRKRFT